MKLITKHSERNFYQYAQNADGNVFHEAIFKSLDQKFNYSPIINVPVSVEVVSRETDKKQFIFCFNQDDSEDQIFLEEKLYDMITKSELEKNISIPPLEVRIFVRKK